MPRRGANHRMLRYLDEFMGTKAAADMLRLGLFPNAKEITESWGILRAARKSLRLHPGDPNVRVVVVGDGCTPRTAGLVAFFTRWQALSIDPNMRKEDWPVERMRARRAMIEDVGVLPWTDDGATTLLILSPHAHVKPDVALAALPWNGPRHYVNMPCCVRAGVTGRDPTLSICDESVLSPERNIHVYENV